MSTASVDAPAELVLPPRARLRTTLLGPEAVQMRTPYAAPLPKSRQPSMPGVSVASRRVDGGWSHTSTYTVSATTSSGAHRRPVATTSPVWWEAFEAACNKQRAADSRRGNVAEDWTVAEYFHSKFWPLYRERVEATTANKAESAYTKHILPNFGSLHFDEVTVEMIEHWAHEMVNVQKLAVSTADHYVGVLRGFFNWAIRLNGFDGKNPCAGVQIYGKKGKRLRTLRPHEWYEDLRPRFAYGRLTLLFVDLTLGTGLRFGEATALRPRDLITQGGKPYLIIAYNITWPGTEKTDNGWPCQENEYLKGDTNKSARKRGKRAERKIRISDDLHKRLANEIQLRELKNADLFFPHEIFRAERNLTIGFVRNDDECPDEPVLTKAGVPKAHGTATAYNAGCHGRACREANTLHRQMKRAQKTGKTFSNRPGDVGPRQGTVGERTDWMSNQWWNELVWGPAVDDAGLGWDCSFHDLRHAHATWLIRSGVDLYEVKDRLGHATTQHTEDYVGVINDTDDWEAEQMTQMRDSIYEPRVAPTVTFALDDLSVIKQLDPAAKMALIHALTS